MLAISESSEIILFIIKLKYEILFIIEIIPRMILNEINIIFFITVINQHRLFK